MVVTHRESGDQLCIGIEVTTMPKLRETIESVEASGGDFVVGPIVHPRYERGFQEATMPNLGDGPDKARSAIVRKDPFTRSDLELLSSEWSSGFIGKLSPWIRCDSDSARLRRMSESAVIQEIAFASHLALRAVVTPPIVSGSGGANLSRTLYSALTRSPNMQIWARVPLRTGSDPDAPRPPTLSCEKQGARKSDSDQDEWEAWNQLRMLCDGHPNLGIALELTATMPKDAVERWSAEPVRAVLVSMAAFVPNRHGYPVLPKGHQELVRQMFKFNCYFAIQSKPGTQSRTGTGDTTETMAPYVQYLGHLFGKQPGKTEEEKFEAPYYDYLQAPLQPLADNLESNVYEVFEKDPVKYERYREAVAQYLQTRGGKVTIIMVLGAGRGPLVRCCLRASQETGAPVKIFAIEKNPYAVVSLQNLVVSEGWDNVEIVATDMRQWQPAEKGDLIVSELLGSFGDNELSPECLDGAEACLKKDGVSIPSAYTSYLAPLSSAQLRNEVRALGDTLNLVETPYVVKIHRGFLVAPTQPCFSFSHPRQEGYVDNARYVRLNFTATDTVSMDGLAGYFEATLFGDVKLSINPPTFSTGMFSWFPLFFPLRRPVHVKRGADIEVHIWRRCTPTRVWYEWCVSAPETVPIHNPNGRSYAMRLG